MYEKNRHPAAASPADGSGLPGLWLATMEIQARLFSEYTDCLLSQLSKNQELVAEQMKKFSSRTEQVASLMAHAAVRSLAIATQARQEESDRRVFPLPLPKDRRSLAREDRRTSPFRNGTASVINLR